MGDNCSVDQTDDCRLAKGGDVEALSRLVTTTFNTVLLNAKPLSSEMFSIFVEARPETTNYCFPRIDSIFAEIIKRNNQSAEIISFLKVWFGIHAAERSGYDLVGLFEQTFNAIANQRPLLDSLLTRWLIDDNLAVSNTAGALIAWLKARDCEDLGFSKPVLDTLDPAQLLLLVRRLIGHCALHDTILLSLSVSLLKTENAIDRTYPLVARLLVHEFGLNYGYWALEQLQTQASLCQEQEKALFQEVVAHTKQQLERLESLPKLAELRAPAAFSRALSLRKHQKTQKIMEQANEGSLMSLISTRIPLKAGKRFFSYYGGQITPPSELMTTEIRVRLPRQSLSDPAGYERHILNCKSAQLEQV